MKIILHLVKPYKVLLEALQKWKETWSLETSNAAFV